VDFAYSPRTEELRSRMLDFMDRYVRPNEPVYEAQLAGAGNRHAVPPIVPELAKVARSAALWNLFLPDERWGAGLTNLEYAPLAEIMAWSPDFAPEVFNCSAPDTGNMEILAMFGTPMQQERWLRPLLDGRIRSCFSMTEPAVASSDATNIQARVERRGDRYVVTGRKWWTSGALDPRCEIAIVMGVGADATAPPHARHSMVVVPLDAPGVVIERSLPVFGYDRGRGGHAQILYDGVEVPADHLLGEEGGGFAIAQARLGPGRIHHAMRAVGIAERAFTLMCRRAHEREPFGQPLAEQGVVQEWIARSRMMIDQCRLLVLKTAWLMDTVGNKGAHVEIAAIKVAAADMASYVLDRAIQVHGGAGVSDDLPLAHMYAHMRAVHIGDGPDEVHIRSIARRELTRLRAADPAEAGDPADPAEAGDPGGAPGSPDGDDR
jgi:acyl-CoA dehydrogenase